MLATNLHVKPPVTLIAALVILSIDLPVAAQLDSHSKTIESHSSVNDGTHSSPYHGEYPTTTSKKGLQVEVVDDALSLGVRHAALNLNLSQLIDLDHQPKNPSLQVGQQRFYFKRAYLQHLDSQIKPLSDAGVLVNLIALSYLNNDDRVNRLLIHPDCIDQPPNRLGAMNTRTAEGRQALIACFRFLAERWSRPDQKYGRVVGWVVGNEVNSHWWWSNMGRVSMQEFTDEYAKLVRLVHSAVRSQADWPRVYISLEHHWNMRYPPSDARQAFPGKDFLEYFAERIKADGDFDWHLAFHPYPENLFDAAFWEDETAIDAPETPRITFKNLPVLTRFLRRDSMLFAGKPRRVILSEQGFHSPRGRDGERLQAAAFCLAYRLVENNPGIDAFILHRHIDHPHEGGLNLGLRRRGKSASAGHPKKTIYDCFKYADTPAWQTTFAFALPIVGLRDWPAGAQLP